MQTNESLLSYEMMSRKQAEEAFKLAGEVHVESFLNRIQKRIDVDHHDMGFLYAPSCVAAWQLTGNETAKKAALLQIIRLTIHTFLTQKLVSQ